MKERIISRLSNLRSLEKISGSIYPTGRPKLLHLLRGEVFEVDKHIFTRHAWHLQQFRSVRKAG